jgi:hypothetical protein
LCLPTTSDTQMPSQVLKFRRSKKTKFAQKDTPDSDENDYELIQICDDAFADSLSQGCLVLVRKGEVKLESIHAIYLPGDALLLRRIRKDRNGQLVAYADNPNFPDFPISRKQVYGYMVSDEHQEVTRAMESNRTKQPLMLVKV